MSRNLGGRAFKVSVRASSIAEAKKLAQNGDGCEARPGRFAGRMVLNLVKVEV